MIYINGLSGEDFDFLGTYKVFENIKYNFTASINSEMNPLTDEEGKPYDGYQFKLLDAVLKIFIMINNLHIRDPNDQPIKSPYTPPVIPLPTSPAGSAAAGMSGAIAGVGNLFGDVIDGVGDSLDDLLGGRGTKRRMNDDDDSTRSKQPRTVAPIRQRYLDNIENNVELLEGLNNSIISENEQDDLIKYFHTPGSSKEVSEEKYRRWIVENANNIDFNMVGEPTIQSELIKKLLYLILKSKLESGPTLPAITYSVVPSENIRRELDGMLKYTIPYSQSIKPGPQCPYFILPHIKLLLAFSAIQSLLPAKTEERAKDPLFMLFFQNPSAIPTGQGIDFAWEKWQDNTIINSIYQILYKLLLFEEKGVYTRIEQGGFLMGGKKNKTRKKRKKKRKTKKAKKKRQNKKRKTRVKRDKRKRKKTRGRKKKN